jgi:hypothetical protein
MTSINIEEFINNITIDIDDSNNLNRKEKKIKEKTKKTIKKPRRGYKTVLVSNETLKAESAQLQNEMIKIENLSKTNELNQCDIAALYTLVYLKQRYSTQLFQSYKPIMTIKENKTKIQSQFYANYIQFNKSVEKRLDEMNCKTLYDCINCFVLRSIPDTARDAFVNWYSGKCQLGINLL